MLLPIMSILDYVSLNTIFLIVGVLLLFASFSAITGDMQSNDQELGLILLILAMIAIAAGLGQLDIVKDKVMELLSGDYGE